MKRLSNFLGLFILLFFASLALSWFGDESWIGKQAIPKGYSVTSDWLERQDRLARLDLLKRVLYYVRERYVEPERVSPEEMFKSVLNRSAEAVSEVRVLYPSSKQAVLLVDDQRKEFSTDIKSLFALHASIADTLQFIRQNQISKMETNKLEEIAIQGVLETLDPHSVFLSEELYQETRVGTSGTFGGLGIIIGIRENKLTVIAPLEGTPAFKAGIKAGDVVSKIDSESTINMTLTEAVERMRGPKGSSVTLAIMREGFTANRDYTIVRDIINIVSIESELLPNQVGYLKLKTFPSTVAKDLSNHLDKLRASAGGELKGLILDLRNNPGGLLDQAIAVADKFLSSGPIVTTIGMSNKIRDEENATEPGTESLYPLVVLVNPGSASASEIVAGAIQRRERGLVIGQTTFGKGSVQSIYDLPEKSALKLTIAQYLTPGGHSIQNIGITPDIYVAPAFVSKERLDIFPNSKKRGEAHLDRHLENPNGAMIKSSNDLPQPQHEIELHYFEDRTIDEIADEYVELSTPSPKGESKTENLLKNFEIKVAAAILNSTKSWKRPEMLEASKRVAKDVESKEVEKIVKALQEREINWKENSTSKNVRECKPIQVKTSFSGNKSKNLIRAGEKVEMSVTVRNKSACTLSRLWASTESENFLLTEREFLFGTIKPNEEITRKIELEIPKSIQDELTEVHLEFKEDHQHFPEKQSIQVAFASLDAPHFAVSYKLIDGQESETLGNKDGLPQRGEKLGLRLKILNVGNGDSSKETFASIRNKSGKDIFLTRGRAEVNVIPAGGSTDVLFLFDVRPGHMEPFFSFELVVADTEYGEFIRKDVEFAVVPETQISRKDQVLKIKRSNANIYFHPRDRSDVLANLPISTLLQSDAQIAGFYRVPLDQDPFHSHAYIQMNDVDVADNPSVEKMASIIPARLEAPRIHLASKKKAQHPLQDKFFEMKGRISDNTALKDLYVRVNDKKVFFQSFVKGNRSKDQEFTATIPLDAGRNFVTVVAHDDQGLVKQESFILLRNEVLAKSFSTPVNQITQK